MYSDYWRSVLIVAAAALAVSSERVKKPDSVVVTLDQYPPF